MRDFPESTFFLQSQHFSLNFEGSTQLFEFQPIRWILIYKHPTRCKIASKNIEFSQPKGFLLKWVISLSAIFFPKCPRKFRILDYPSTTAKVKLAEKIEGVFGTPKTFKNLHTPKFCALSFATIHFIVGHLRSSQNRHCWKNIFCVGSHFFHHFPQRPWKLTSPKILRRTASRASWHARSWWWVWNHHQKKIRVPTNLGVQPCQLSRL